MSERHLLPSPPKHYTWFTGRGWHQTPWLQGCFVLSSWRSWTDELEREGRSQLGEGEPWRTNNENGAVRRVSCKLIFQLLEDSFDVHVKNQSPHDHGAMIGEFTTRRTFACPQAKHRIPDRDETS